jgi:hypothetical protein
LESLQVSPKQKNRVFLKTAPVKLSLIRIKLKILGSSRLLGGRTAFALFRQIYFFRLKLIKGVGPFMLETN